MKRLLLAGSLLLAGCPKTVLPPPPKAGGGPAAEMLAKREAAIRAIEADVTIRMRVPEGIEGAPGGKVRGHVVADQRARLDIWTPLGTLGAILLIADGELQVYSPLENRLMKGPLESKEIADRSPLPLPLAELPALLRGAVKLEQGELGPGIAEAQPGRTVLVTRDGRIVQEIVVDPEGGYPLSNVYFADGKPSLSIHYLDYGGVETAAGLVAFPQKVTATIERPEGTVSLEVTISNPKVNPTLPADAFTLAFQTPPRVEEFP